ncbi:LacI family DNA-binding transcriptional regulator [Saccharicrinis aurantiacus]|uniref:LacI family DNA-binding transcriptional regulator n=1 Tax=Saccharicrinis aurantiacus TaxID=1849719 RepID=UPI00094FE826|nr:LacI family DNA-binding transcriptional regulator [Saccharicrinis aurantiacus]
MSTNRITIKDIAKKLDCTPSTVSRALAGNTRVSLKTRNLVKKTAVEMGYRPNAIASALRKGKVDTIGMIVPRINRYFFSNVISGVEDILNPAGYNLVICQSNENEYKEQKAVQTLLQNQVGGILISLSVETNNYEHLNSIIASGTPLVQFDRVNLNIESPIVINNNFEGAYLATEYLIKQGYKNIGHFGGNPKIMAYSERYNGYIKAMNTYNMNINDKLIKFDTITQETGSSELIRFFNDNEIDALFCSSDFAALGALEALNKMKVDIPSEFGIIGFANEPFTKLISPKLSSVEQNSFKLGRTAAIALLNSIDNKPVETNQTVDVEFIPRQSSNKSI